MEMEELARSLADQYFSLHEQAYEIYKPLVDDICSRKVTEKELSHLLDYMLGFCGYDKFLELYIRVCRNYRKIYPQLIFDYVCLYKELYIDEKELEDGTD